MNGSYFGWEKVWSLNGQVTTTTTKKGNDHLSQPISDD